MAKKTRKRLTNIPSDLLKLPPGMLQGLILRLTRDSYAVHLPAHHSSRSILGASCAKTDLLLLSGRDATDDTGKVTIRIDDLLCGSISEDISPGFLVMVREPNFVVTPLSATPAFATVKTASTPFEMTDSFLEDRAGNTVHGTQIRDVTVDVMTWKPDGSPAGKTSFSWICAIEAVHAIPIGG